MSRHPGEITVDNILAFTANNGSVVVHRRDANNIHSYVCDLLGRLEKAEAERDTAFAMSKCECGSEEACRNLVNARNDALEEAARVATMYAMIIPHDSANAAKIQLHGVALAIRALKSKS